MDVLKVDRNEHGHVVRAGLTVNFGTDDAVSYGTSLAREYQEALPALGRYRRRSHDHAGRRRRGILR